MDRVRSFGLVTAIGFLLLWVYYSCQVLLFGAEFTRVCALSRGARPAP